MELKFDFGKELDLTYFRKQSSYYIGKMRELDYRVYIPNYKILITTVAVNDRDRSHRVTISIFDIRRDNNNSIIDEKPIFPISDIRFKSIESIFGIFPIDHYRALFEASDPNDTSNKLCAIISTVYRINKLKAFL